MASEIRLIADNVDYFLSGSGAVYTGTGTPWTTQATTPYEIAMNEIGGRWTPQVAEAQEVYGGGPPFRIGQSLITRSWGLVSETIPIQIRADTHDNAVFLKQQLAKILNLARFREPCILAVRPTNTTNTIYYEILSADVQEGPEFINEEAGRGLLRLQVRWRRTPVGGLLSSGESVFLFSTFTNTTTSPNGNTQAYPANPSGELIYEGQPMNLELIPGTPGIATKLYIASVLSVAYSTNLAGTYSTSDTNGTSVASTIVTFPGYLTNRGVRLRVLIRFGTRTSNLEMRIAMIVGGTELYRSPWIGAGSFPSLPTILDFGGFSPQVMRWIRQQPSASCSLVVSFRSTDGANASGTISYHELLLYYDFATIDITGTSVTSTKKLVLTSYQEVSGRPCLPQEVPTAVDVVQADNALDRVRPIRGRLPRLYAGASLYLAWDGGNGHVTTDTLAVLANHAPLWTSFRGLD